MDTHLAELGERTARWLEGHAPEPFGGYDEPDTETQHLIPALATLNRAGYVTTGSQPGEPPGPGMGGKDWQQRAAVDGFADDDTLARIKAVVACTELVLIVNRIQVPPNWHRWIPARARPLDRRGWTGQVVVSASTDGEGATWFGGRMPYDDFELNFKQVDDATFTALLNAWQVTVIDPRWGRDDLLWDTLTDLKQSQD